MAKSYAEVPLSQGRVVLIDWDDVDSVSRWSWHFDGRYARGYPHSVKEYLHRFIMKPKAGEIVDHINGDRLDCRRANMRNCSPSINTSNQHTATKNKHGYRGVYRRGKSYRSEIYYLGKHYALGTFKTPAAAHRAYLKAKALLHSGKSLG